MLRFQGFNIDFTLTTPDIDQILAFLRALSKHKYLDNHKSCKCETRVKRDSFIRKLNSFYGFVPPVQPREAGCRVERWEVFQNLSWLGSNFFPKNSTSNGFDFRAHERLSALAIIQRLYQQTIIGWGKSLPHSSLIDLPTRCSFKTVCTSLFLPLHIASCSLWLFRE